MGPPASMSSSCSYKSSFLFVKDMTVNWTMRGRETRLGTEHPPLSAEISYTCVQPSTYHVHPALLARIVALGDLHMAGVPLQNCGQEIIHIGISGLGVNAITDRR